MTGLVRSLVLGRGGNGLAIERLWDARPQLRNTATVLYQPHDLFVAEKLWVVQVASRLGLVSSSGKS